MRLEEQVVEISHNMSLIMVALANKLGRTREVGVSNSEIRLEGKLGENEDVEKESRKEPRKGNLIRMLLTLHSPY